MDHTHESLFIAGQWQKPVSSRRIEVTSASTEESLGSVPEAAEGDIDRAVAAARVTFTDPAGWASWEPARRGAALERFAAALEKRGEQLAQLVSSQNGTQISIGRVSEAVSGPALLRCYAAIAQQAPAEETRPSVLGGGTVVRRERVGVVAAIVPWNFPKSLTFFKVAPGFAAGCTVVLKPAPGTVLDAFLLAEAAAEADLPPGVLNIVPAGREAGAYLVRHPGVDKVAFTGSIAAGRAVAEECGRLLRPVTLELGGKSAAIVLDDADLAGQLDKFFAATLLNKGQTCYLGTRVLARRSRYDQVVEVLTGLAFSLQVGDALEDSTQIGPLVSRRQRDRVEGWRPPGSPFGGVKASGMGRELGPEGLAAFQQLKSIYLP